jgi:hypothetical protein
VISLRPISLRQANKFRRGRGAVALRACDFAIGAQQQASLIGVVVGSAPTQLVSIHETLELHLCSDDAVASMLIAAATRAAFAMGVRRVVSHVRAQEDERFRAAGWHFVEAVTLNQLHRWQRTNPELWFDGLDPA